MGVVRARGPHTREDPWPADEQGGAGASRRVVVVDDLLATGGTMSAGIQLLRKVGAEQKLFGGVSISGSIGETPLGTTNKSVTAGFKQSW